MNKEEVPSVNPKLDAMCEMLKTIHDLNERNKMLEAQIEKMKADVMANIKWADANKNNQMYFKLNAMFNQWEIKENAR